MNDELKAKKERGIYSDYACHSTPHYYVSVDLKGAVHGRKVRLFSRATHDQMEISPRSFDKIVKWWLRFSDCVPVPIPRQRRAKR